MKYVFTLLILLSAFSAASGQQDTVRISLPMFIDIGLERSGQVQYERGAVHLAQNRVDEVRSNRVLPSAELNTNHGLVPGVVSQQSNLPREQFYLDPNLENDWENWAIFTRAEISAVQPLFSWGAINKAIRAAESGAVAAGERFNVAKRGVELQLVEFYYSYLLLIEIERILDDAQDKIDRIGAQIDQMVEGNDPSFEQKDIYQFEIYKSQFEIQRAEVEQRTDHIMRIWDAIFEDGGDTVYIPEDEFLNPVTLQIESFDHYYSAAMSMRSEMKGVEAGIQAYEHSIEAVKAQSYPMLYLGLTASFANTPNRPRQSNPFIINNTNFLSAGLGLGIRQNLNFPAINNRIKRERIEYERVRDLKHAFSDQIMIELSERYGEAVAAQHAVEKINEAITTSKEWVRLEELNYDLGFGDVEDLVDAVRKELELRVELQHSVFNLNKKIAELYKAAGLPVAQYNSN